MKKIILFLFILFISWMSIITFSCDSMKKNSLNDEYKSGIILDFGNPAVDGCGWMIEIDSALYAPINLDSEFYKDSLKVYVNCTILTSIWNCGWRTSGYSEIEIITIKAR